MLLLNVFLALIWTALTGTVSPANLLLGFGLGFGFLWLAHRPLGSSPYFAGAWKMVELAAYFAWELMRASLQLAYHVASPNRHIQPAVLLVQLDLSDEVEMTLLANLVTLTPGTLTLEVSKEQRWIAVHVMDARDLDAARHHIKQGFERRILEISR